MQLAPKAIDTLHVLIERRGRVVEKAELMKLVWPDTVVEEVGLARNVSLLRKALGDELAESPYNETIPRRGYRFAAAEAPSPGPTPTHRPRWLPAACIAALIAIASLIYWQFYVPRGTAVVTPRNGFRIEAPQFGALLRRGNARPLAGRRLTEATDRNRY